MPPQPAAARSTAAVGDPPSRTATEVASQPALWRRSLADLAAARSALAAPGERVLLLGCGTSAFVAHALARLREAAGLGESDWAYASEAPLTRGYDRLVAITRSGTTTEILDALAQAPSSTRRIVLTAVAGMPAQEQADETLVLSAADERSVVQTRFPTTTLYLARAAFGESLDRLAEVAAAADVVLAGPLAADPAAYGHVVFLGHSWGVGLADEAALKTRETSQAWAESYPALDYRHGPIAVAAPGTLVWVLGAAPPGLVAQIRATGADVVSTGADPLVDLVAIHRFALALAAHRGLDPDAPRHLTRSVVLDPIS
jgi:fructoselysine-6-P-deglycase FrlB-like protein